MDDTHSRIAGRITSDLAELNESLARSAASAGTVTLDQSTVGRLSRMDALQQQAMAQEMGARLLSRKRALEAASARIEAGTFGWCCQCDAEIGVERLEAEPAAVLCTECVLEREANKSGRGTLPTTKRFLGI